MHDKQRIEIIIERMAMRRACEILEAAEITGYTVISAMEGYGGRRRWRRGDDLSASEEMVVIIAIGDEARVTAALGELQRLLKDRIGVLSVGAVTVLRPDLF
jgi:PII-like signaling protein